MKKWMLSTVAVLIGTMAMAQSSFYGEWRRKIGGKVKTEVVALSFDIPDEAFAKITEVTWIK